MVGQTNAAGYYEIEWSLQPNEDLMIWPENAYFEPWKANSLDC